MHASDRLLDTARAVETPEGVTIEYRVAGPIPRSLAWAIDFGIRAVAYIALGGLFTQFGRFGFGLFTIAFFLLEWFYPVLFEVYRNGATPGKRALRITVLQDDGLPVGWAASMVRNLLRAADFLPFLYGCGLCSMLLTRDFKRLGDIAAHTVVVHDETARASALLPEAKPLAPPVRLSSIEQQALLAFAARAPRLTKERIDELAAMLASIPGNPDAGTLLRYARYIAGYR